MKFTLPSGRVVMIGTHFTENKPSVLFKPVSEEYLKDHPFRTTEMRVTLMHGDDNTETGETIDGICYCHPYDRYIRLEGRKKATRRLLRKNSSMAKRILTKTEVAALVPVLLTGRVPEAEKAEA